MPMRESMITIGAIYTHDQLALQVKESCLSQSPGAIQRYSSLNKVVVSLWVFSDPESVVGNMEVRVPGGMASTPCLSFIYETLVKRDREFSWSFLFVGGCMEFFCANF